MCHVTYTQNGDAAWETAAFIDTLKSVLHRKYRSLLHLVYSNRKGIYEIFMNDMFYNVMTNPMEL